MKIKLVRQDNSFLAVIEVDGEKLADAGILKWRNSYFVFSNLPRKGRFYNAAVFQCVNELFDVSDAPVHVQ